MSIGLWLYSFSYENTLKNTKNDESYFARIEVKVKQNSISIDI